MTKPDTSMREQWIYLEDRKPPLPTKENNDPVLITYETDIGDYKVAFAHYIGKGWKIDRPHFKHIQTNEKIIAWMPIPEPAQICLPIFIRGK